MYLECLISILLNILPRFFIIWFIKFRGQEKKKGKDNEKSKENDKG